MCQSRYILNVGRLRRMVTEHIITTRLSEDQKTSVVVS